MDCHQIALREQSRPRRYAQNKLALFPQRISSPMWRARNLLPAAIADYREGRSEIVEIRTSNSSMALSVMPIVPKIAIGLRLRR
jgi:hypothetical protein